MNLKPLFLQILWACCLLTSGGSAWALKEDQNAPTAIESDAMTYDELKQINVFTGNVKLVRGTLVLRGEKLTLKQTPEGFQIGLAEGKPASFRQRRDGVGELYVEGFGDRIDYDGKTETVVLTHNAEMRKLEGKKVTDEVKGEVITYLQRTEFFTVVGDPSSPKAGTAGRVKVIIQPKEDKVAK